MDSLGELSLVNSPRARNSFALTNEIGVGPHFQADVPAFEDPSERPSPISLDAALVENPQSLVPNNSISNLNAEEELAFLVGCSLFGKSFSDVALLVSRPVGPGLATLITGLSGENIFI